MSNPELRNVSKVITKGTTPSSVGSGFTSSGINFVKSESVSESKYLNNAIFTYIDEETDEKLKRSRLETNDLLFSIAGAYLGKVAIVRKEDLPANTNQAVGIVRLDDNLVDVNYIYYYFSQKHINEYINQLSSQSSQPNLNLELLGKLTFISRNLEEQKKIAAVLSALDAKIEVNNRINAELESLAKTIYDYWFVQFDFPNEDGKPYKASGGEMVYHPELKREIPADWEVGKLVNLCHKIGDGIHGTPKYVDDSDYHFINGNNLNNGFISINNDTKNVNYDEYQKYFIDLNEETILLSINGTLGNLAIYTGEKVMLGKSAAYINCKEKYRSYCYQFLKSDHIQKNFWNIATGSTIKNLSLESLKNTLILVPNKDLIEQYYKLMKPLDNKRINIFKQNQQLTQLRDWLLPLLMNGQITVE